MNVLNIHNGQDTGGQGWRMFDAFRRLAPDWTFHHIVSPQTFTYLQYPTDLPWSAAKDAWEAADVVHLHNNFTTAYRFERKRGEKPAVIHYHGTNFRTNPFPRLRDQRQRKAIGLVSTLDLWLIEPSQLEWLPAPYDLDWLAKMRKPRKDKRIVVAHAPTAREIKSTGTFERAIYQLNKEGYPVEADIIEKVPWAECLRRKASADIYFDQIKLGYGCNAIEAWGMGIPVIAGGADATLDEMERRFGYLPFHHATEETIADAIRELVESPELRRKMAQRGTEHVRRYHDERLVVEQLKAAYQRAAGISEERAA